MGFRNSVIEYIENNYDDIENDMNKRNILQNVKVIQINQKQENREELSI